MVSKMKKSKKVILLTAIIMSTIIIAACGKKENSSIGEQQKGETIQLENKDFLKTDGTKVKNTEGQEIILRGTNAGGWLLQEFWMCPTEQTENVSCQKEMIQVLKERFGEEKAEELLDVYEDNFWTEADFDNCRDLGMNVIRLPFTYMNFLDDNGELKDDAFERVDWFVEQAGKRGMYVILDMHGAQGSQNEKDHSGDTTQGASFFYGENAGKNQTEYVQLWEKIAEHYNGNPVVAGYDLLNEPYCDLPENTGKTCWDIYDRAYKAIRKIDEDHIVIVEAKWDPVNLPDPKEYAWENIIYEYHQYNYTDQHNAEAQLEGIALKLDLADAAGYGVPNYIGETSFFDNMESWEQCLNEMNRRGCNYTTWSYKVTGDGSNTWGIYNIQADKANIETDDYDTIKEKWSSQSDLIENKEVKEILEKYFTGYCVED